MCYFYELLFKVFEKVLKDASCCIIFAITMVESYSFKQLPINFSNSSIKFAFFFSIMAYPFAELAEGILIRAPLWWLI
jgi:hypothetical protein